MPIGERIEKLIYEKGMSLSEASRYFNISFGTLKNAITGKSAINQKSIQKIAAIEPEFKEYVESQVDKKEKKKGYREDNTSSLKLRDIKNTVRKKRYEKPDRDIEMVNRDAFNNGISYGYQSVYEHLGWI